MREETELELALWWNGRWLGSGRKKPQFIVEALVTAGVKRPLIREDLKVIQYQSQEADNTFITSDGTSLYNSTRKWVVKRHYREDNN